MEVGEVGRTGREESNWVVAPPSMPSISLLCPLFALRVNHDKSIFGLRWSVWNILCTCNGWKCNRKRSALVLTFDANLSFACCRFTALSFKKCLHDDFISLVEHGW